MITRLIRYLLLLFILFISLLGALVHTEAGTHWLVKQLAVTGLSVQNVTGRLTGPLELNKVHYQDSDYRIDIDKISLDWSPLALLEGKLHVHKVQSNTVAIAINQGETTSSPSPIMDFLLPKAWHIDNVHIKHLSLKRNQQHDSVSANDVQLQGIYSTDKIDILARWKTLNWRNNDQLMLHNSTSNIRVTGNPVDYRFQGQLKFQPILDKVSTKPTELVGTIDLAVAQQALTINHISLLSNHTQINIQGKLSDRYDLTWKARTQNIGELLPHSKGSLLFNGTLTGSSHAPLLRSQFTLAGISYDDYQLRSAAGVIEGALQDQGKLALKVNAQALSIGELLIHQFSLQTSGTISRHSIKADILSNKGSLTGRASGSFDLDAAKWQGKITGLDLRSPVLGNWHLSQPVIASFSPTVNAIHNLYLQQGKQSIFIDGSWSDQHDSQFTLDINSLGLNTLKAFFPEKVRLNSTLDAAIKLERKHRQAMTGHAKIHLAKGSIQYPFKEQFRNFHFNPSSLLADLNPTGLNIDFDLPLANQQRIQARINLPYFPQPAKKQTITGDVKLSLYDLSVLSSVIPHLENPEGRLAADIKLSGTIDKLITQGNIKLTQAKTAIPALGIHLRNIQFTASGDPSGNVTLKGQAFSRKGMLYLKGQTRLSDSNMAGTFSFTGDHFLISNLPEYKVYISPRLVLKARDNNLFLSGEITIPKAKLRPQQYSQESIEVTSDIQYIDNDDQALDKTPFNFYSNIHLTLGNSVNIDYSGLSGQLTGGLQIKDSPTSAATGLGTLYLVGNYKAYGQALAINQGRLSFTGGDVANPSLDVQAEKTINLASATSSSGPTNLNNAAALVAQGNKVIIGVTVQGTVNNRQITLFSRPPILNQTDILSYLVLGRPAAQATQADAQLLYNAATALDFGGSQVGNLSEQVKNSLGLDEINIGSMASAAPQTGQSTTDNTSLILGKALTPKLYLNYSIGLIEPVNTLRLRYFFTPSWIVQSETNSLANAVDLFYTFDR